jgi:peptide chain release factor 3
MKSKQLEKGIEQLSDEGVAQLFTVNPGNRKIIGTVGDLQFEVIQYRLLNEYGASCRYQHLNFYKACWITSDDEAALQDFLQFKSGNIAYDKDNNPVYFAESSWILNTQIEKYPKLQFHFTSDFKMEAAK